ncbi:hypothetical protein [Latilactobacillus curvatus]|nr:hypothetical protein [Latilactobacillus curvatus]
MQQPEQHYVDLAQQFSATLTDVTVTSDGQTMPANWRQARSPYLIVLEPR